MNSVFQIIGALGIYKFGLHLYKKHHTHVDVEEVQLGNRYFLYKDYFEQFSRSKEMNDNLLSDCSPYLRVNNQIKIVYSDPEISKDPKKQMFIVGIELNEEEQVQYAQQMMKNNKGYQIAEIPESANLICKEEEESIGESPFNEYIIDIMFPAVYSVLHSKKIDDQGQFIEKQIYDPEGKLSRVEISYPTNFRVDKYINHSLIKEKIRKQQEEEEQRKQKEEAERLKMEALKAQQQLQQSRKVK